MNRTRILTAAIGTTLIGAATLFSSVASAGGKVAPGRPGVSGLLGQPAQAVGDLGLVLLGERLSLTQAIGMVAAVVLPVYRILSRTNSTPTGRNAPKLWPAVPSKRK